MPESEGPPGEPLDYAGFASALPTFGEEEQSPLFPGFCQNEHFPAEALYLYQNSASDLSSSFGRHPSMSAYYSNEGQPLLASGARLSAHAAEEAAPSLSGAMSLDLASEQFQRPEGRKRKWRKYEDEALMSIVSYTSQGNGDALRDESFWEQVSAKISEALNTNRSARSCLKRYHKLRLRANLLTKAEQKMIAEMSFANPKDSDSTTLTPLELTGERGDEPTPVIATRAGSGGFTPEEDKYLVHLYLKTNKNWRKISAMMPHRTEQQLKGRFYKKLKRHYEQERRSYDVGSRQRTLRSKRRSPAEKPEEEKQKDDCHLKELCLSCKGTCAPAPLFAAAPLEERKEEGEGGASEQKGILELEGMDKEQRIEKLKQQEAFIERELAKLKQSLNSLISERGIGVQEEVSTP